MIGLLRHVEEGGFIYVYGLVTEHPLAIPTPLPSGLPGHCQIVMPTSELQLAENKSEAARMDIERAKIELAERWARDEVERDFGAPLDWYRWSDRLDKAVPA